jgi:hypothetical protein
MVWLQRRNSLIHQENLRTHILWVRYIACMEKVQNIWRIFRDFSNFWRKKIRQHAYFWKKIIQKNIENIVRKLVVHRREQKEGQFYQLSQTNGAIHKRRFFCWPLYKSHNFTKHLTCFEKIVCYFCEKE